MTTDPSEIIKRQVIEPTNTLSVRFPVYYIQISDGYEFEDYFGKVKLNFESSLRIGYFYDEYKEKNHVVLTKYPDKDTTLEEAKIIYTLDDDDPITAYMSWQRVKAGLDIYYWETHEPDFVEEQGIKGRFYTHFHSLIKKSANQNTKNMSTYRNIFSRFAYHLLYGKSQPITTTVSIPVQWQTEYREEPFEDTFDITVT